MSNERAKLPLKRALGLLFAKRIQVIDRFFKSCVEQAGKTLPFQFSIRRVTGCHNNKFIIDESIVFCVVL